MFADIPFSSRERSITLSRYSATYESQARVSNNKLIDNRDLRRPTLVGPILIKSGVLVSIGIPWMLQSA